MANKEIKNGFFKKIDNFLKKVDSPVMEDLPTRMSRKIIQRCNEIGYEVLNGDNNFNEKDIPKLLEKLSKSGFLKWGDGPAVVEQSEDENKISIEFDPTPMCTCSKITIEGIKKGLPLFLTRENGPYGIDEKRVQIDDISYFNEILARKIFEAKDITS